MALGQESGKVLQHLGSVLKSGVLQIGVIGPFGSIDVSGVNVASKSDGETGYAPSAEQELKPYERDRAMSKCQGEKQLESVPKEKGLEVSFTECENSIPCSELWWSDTRARILARKRRTQVCGGRARRILSRRSALPTGVFFNF